MKKIVIELIGPRALICKGDVRTDLKATFYVRINGTREDILKVAQSIGCQRASRQEGVEDLFAGKFAEALREVAAQCTLEEVLYDRSRFRDHVIQIIGCDLNGFVLEDMVIDELERAVEPSSQRREAAAGEYRDPRSAARARVDALERELAAARQALAAFGDDR